MSSRPNPSSPLSSPTTTRPIPIPRDDIPKKTPQPNLPHKPRPLQSLNLAALPKYHPARFPDKPGDSAPLSPRSIQNLRPGSSSAQAALHKHQRELVTRASGLSELAKPTSPRLIPEGSPAGSLTPLALEAQSDYFLNRSNIAANPADARRLVDELLRKENEARDHPEARGGETSPAITPPV